MKTQLGHYDIVAELGRGGMGVVYKGATSRPSTAGVAIKVLAESLAHDESVKERFLREARSMAALNDPHIIQIYFIGGTPDRPSSSWSSSGRVSWALAFQARGRWRPSRQWRA